MVWLLTRAAMPHIPFLFVSSDVCRLASLLPLVVLSAALRVSACRANITKKAYLQIIPEARAKRSIGKITYKWPSNLIVDNGKGIAVSYILRKATQISCQRLKCIGSLLLHWDIVVECWNCTAKVYPVIYTTEVIHKLCFTKRGRRGKPPCLQIYQQW